MNETETYQAMLKQAFQLLSERDKQLRIARDGILKIKDVATRSDSQHPEPSIYGICKETLTKILEVGK